MKSYSSLPMLSLIFLLWLISVLGCVSGSRQSNSDTNANVDRLAPLTKTQKEDVLDVIKGTDELDAIYNRRSKTKEGLALYAGKYGQTEEKFKQAYASLPKNDAL